MLGQEAFFVGSLTRDLSIIWNTDHFYSNLVTKSKLYYMYHLHKDVISVKNLTQWLIESKHFMKPVIVHICYYHLWNKKATAVAWGFWIPVSIGDTFHQQNCIMVSSQIFPSPSSWLNIFSPWMSQHRVLTTHLINKLVKMKLPH